MTEPIIPTFERGTGDPLPLTESEVRRIVREELAAAFGRIRPMSSRIGDAVTAHVAEQPRGR